MSTFLLSNPIFFDETPDDDEFLTKLLANPDLDNNIQPLQSYIASSDNFQNNEPNNLSQKPRYRKKLYSSPLIGSFLKPKIQSICTAFSYNEKCHCASRLFEVLVNLEWPLEDYLSVLEEFYYDVDTREFEPMSNVYEEIENKDICFLEEYEREYKGLVFSNMERDFWESEKINLKKKKKKRKKKKSINSNINNARKEYNKLLKEREELCNNSIFTQNEGNYDEEVKIHFKKNEKECNDNTRKYKLRERQKFSIKTNQEAFDAEEIKIINQKIKMKYRQLRDQTKIKTSQSETPPILSEKLLLKKIEEKLITQNINKKKSFPSCFIEDKSPQELEEKEANSETVKLSSLGPKRTYRKKKKKENLEPIKKKINKSKKNKKKKPKKPKIEEKFERRLREKRKPIIKETINIDNDNDDNESIQKHRTNINWEIDLY